jgi:hypothetical protein
MYYSVFCPSAELWHIKISISWNYFQNTFVSSGHATSC